MNSFESLIADFSAKTGLNLVPDERQGCFLETEGMMVTIPYRQEADESFFLIRAVKYHRTVRTWNSAN